MSACAVYTLPPEGSDKGYCGLAFEISTVSHTLACNRKLLCFAPPGGYEYGLNEQHQAKKIKVSLLITITNRRLHGSKVKKPISCSVGSVILS